LRRIEAKLRQWHRANAASRRLAKIPSVGPVGACLRVMTTPDTRAFKSARHFAAWLGLTPKDHSTAGKTRLGKITRAGDEILRRLLVAGATAVIQQVRNGRGRPSPWLLALLKRKPPKLAAVALANKIARIAWKLMTTGESYDGARMPGASAVAALEIGPAATFTTGRSGAARAEQMAGSIDPRCETIRGTHWPKQGSVVVWSSRCGNHLGQRLKAPHQKAGYMDSSDPIRPSKKLLWHGGRPHMGPRFRGDDTLKGRSLLDASVSPPVRLPSRASPVCG